MAHNDGNSITNDEARAIVTTRVFDAPPELVFDAWTDPKHISNWWGPRGFRTTTHSMDLRAGGKWTFIMHGPDGTDYDNEITYREVERPSRLAYLHGPVPSFDVTVTFEDLGGKTRVTLRTLFQSAEVRNKVAEEYGAIEGANQTFERFAEHLANANAFSITRELNGPRELVFKLWTESEHLLRWFGPKGMEMFHATNDLRPGGVMHYGLRAANGAEMWGRWTYREINPPHRLVFVSSFSDPDGNVARAPFSGEWPLEMLTTVTFTEANGKTNVTVQSAAINASDAERKTFADAHASMKGGWSGTFEQLEQYLAEVRG